MDMSFTPCASMGSMVSPSCETGRSPITPIIMGTLGP